MYLYFICYAWHLELKDALFFVGFFLVWFDSVVMSGRSGHSPNHTIFLGRLDLAVNQYFLYILSLVTGGE